jgi:hypothetical protein
MLVVYNTSDLTYFEFNIGLYSTRPENFKLAPPEKGFATLRPRLDPEEFTFLRVLPP